MVWNVTDIQGKSHIVCVDYFSCCIFERQLKSLHSSDVIEALKSIFCDVRSPDKLISDNEIFCVRRIQKFCGDLVNTSHNFIPKIPTWKCPCREGSTYSETDISQG